MRRLALLALLCTGCATQWVKPGVDWLDFNTVTFERDLYECRRDAGMQGYRSILGPVFRERWFRYCMRSRGYEQAE